MGKLVFILGGARSGKSKYAIDRAKSTKKRVACIVTCTNPDPEMSERIKLHKKLRPRSWKVIEEGVNLSQTYRNLTKKYQVILIDCLGLFISNLLNEGKSEKKITAKVKELVKSISNSNSFTIVVSNEVGMGVVPDNLLGRKFRDIVGMANQIFSEQADETVFLQAGIPLKIKGGEQWKE